MREAVFASLIPLKPELCSDLTDARIGRFGDETKGASLIADVPVNRVAAKELCVVQDVEHLQAKLQRTGLAESRHFVESHVEVVDAGAVEHSTFRITLRPQGIWREGCCVEERLAAPWIAMDLETGAIVVRHVDAGRIDAVVLHLYQIVITKARKRYRHTGSETSNSGQCPAAGQSIRTPQASDRQVIVVADDKVMFQIEGGYSIQPVIVIRIDLFLDA
jgi:hypothetical protein